MTLSTTKQTNTAEGQAELQFLLKERTSSQWACFLQAFSMEMQSQLSNTEYRELLHSMGMKMAKQFPIAATDTIDALEAGINKQLESIQWGYVRLVDMGNVLNIYHYLNPLTSMLGVNADVSGGFLEGVYEQWFRATCADDGLRVKQVLGSATPTMIEYQFGLF